MRHRSPLDAGSAAITGSDPSEFATQDGYRLRFEICGRLHAVLQELDLDSVDWDVCETLLRGAVESIEAAT